MSGEWITWAGGECPVPPETVVMVRFRHAGETDVDEARCFYWATVGNYGDIIAYRIPEAEPAEPAGAGVAGGGVTPDEIRMCVLRLAHRALGLNLAEWNEISNVFLAAADQIAAPPADADIIDRLRTALRTIADLNVTGDEFVLQGPAFVLRRMRQMVGVAETALTFGPTPPAQDGTAS